jgi:hypothetical protein
MRHPFDGLIVPEREEPSSDRTGQNHGASSGARSSRRSFLGVFAAALAGIGGLVAASEASAQRGWVVGPRGRFGPHPPRFGGHPPRGHGGYPPGLGRRVTTLALGEEGARGYRPRYGRRIITTQALGEESGRWYRY